MFPDVPFFIGVCVVEPLRKKNEGFIPVKEKGAMPSLAVEKDEGKNGFNIPDALFFNPKLTMKDGVPFIEDCQVEKDGVRGIVQFRKSEPLLGYFKSRIAGCRAVLVFAGEDLYRAYQVFLNRDLIEHENQYFESQRPEKPGVEFNLVNFRDCSEQMLYLGKMLEDCYDYPSDCLNVLYGCEAFEEALQKVFDEYSKIMDPKSLLGA